MKKILERMAFVAIALFIPFLGVFAQYSEPVIKEGVLQSWPGARGAIKIPDGVKAIAEQAFYEPPVEDPSGWGSSDAKSNIDITSIDFNQVETIGSEAFKGCVGIKTIVASHIKSIKHNAFEGCSSILSLTLPAIESIGTDAFTNCTELQSISLGASLATLEGGNPFKNNQSLRKIEVASLCKAFYSVENLVVEKKTGTIRVGSQQAEFRLDASIKGIGENAFFNCTEMALFSASECRTISSGAFGNCRKLTELFLPKLEEVSSNWLTFNGVKLSILDLHLSERITTFHRNLANHENFTIYVLNEEVKEKLAKEFTRAKIVVGKPKTGKKYTIAYRCDALRGQIEAWTTGAREVKDREELPEGATVSFKAIPRYGYLIDKWLLNGKEISDGFENSEKSIYSITSVKEDITIEVKFAPVPKGDVIYFDTLAPSYGAICCKLEDGTEVKSAQIVSHEASLIFTAIPNKGYRVTEWKERITNFDAEGHPIFEDKPIAGSLGKLEYRCKAKDGLHILADFNRLENHFIVRYSSLNKFASLIARRQNGTLVESGETIPKGEKIIFTATPSAKNIVVDDWLKNGEPIPNHKEFTYTIESLEEDVRIDVICKEKKDDPIPSDAVIKGGVLISWKPKGEVVLPSVVTKIGAHAFEGANAMTSLTLNEKVTEVGDLAFLYCTSLSRFIVPVGNKSFVAEEGVLYNKDRTRLIAYPAGKKESSYTLLATTQSIQEGALTTCPTLLGVEVAKGNTHLLAVGGALLSADKKDLLYWPTGFRRDQKGEEATIPNGITRIVSYAVAYAPQIKKIKLPLTLEVISSRGFSHCATLEEVSFEKETNNPCVETIGEEAFFYCRRLKKIPYMPALKTLEKGAFAICDELVEVRVPASVTKIAPDTFNKCRAIKAVYAYGKEPLAIDENLFKDILFMEEATLYVPKGSKEKYASARGWKIFKNIEESKELTSIDEIRNSIEVSTSDIAYTIRGLKEGIRYQVYTLDGSLLQRGVVLGESLIIPKERDTLLLLKIENNNSAIVLM